MSSFRGSVISLIIVSVIRGSSVFIIRIVKSIIRMSRGLVSGTISFNEWGTSGIRVMSARWTSGIWAMSARWTSGIRMVGTSWHGRSWKPHWRKRSPWRQTMGWGSWSGWFSFWKIHGWIVAMSVLRIVRIGVIVTRVHFIIVSIFLHSA
uniref:Uncharacterized protein n=1 Tax=Cacopsylla melanoneura TaxID=428564 RepID=A0A8D8ZK21_9HEMI